MPSAPGDIAKSANGCGGSSHFAAPSLRYGPPGSTPHPLARRLAMAGSRLPATEGRPRMKKRKENREVNRSTHENGTAECSSFFARRPGLALANLQALT